MGAYYEVWTMKYFATTLGNNIRKSNDPVYGKWKNKVSR